MYRIHSQDTFSNAPNRNRHTRFPPFQTATNLLQKTMTKRFCMRIDDENSPYIFHMASLPDGRLQVPGKRICPVKPFDLHGYSPPPSEHTCCCSQNPCVVLLMSSRSSARFPSDLSQNPSCPLTDLKSIFPLQLPCWDPVVAWRIGSPGGGTAGSSGGNGLGAGRPRGC